MVGTGRVERAARVLRRVWRKAVVLQGRVSAVDAFGFLGGRGEEDIRGLLVLGKRLALFEVGAGAKRGVDGRREDQGACWALFVGACHAAEALVPGR